ncbi:unnamed protein product [Linum tenue]|uniref:DUF4283 domain-containing protein n=1 Tax=Linum tenue TaxID=586396 RepID=A0AAV0ITA5_9ROSI|nr:unnamed protein product [Linum tenue]
MKQGQDKFVEVSREGVDERLNFLGRCLVIRPISISEVFSKCLLSDFNRWARRVWAIDDNFGIEELEDGCWLLICPSVAEALRIRKLQHSQFRSFRFKISMWNPNIGRDAGHPGKETWLLVFGIPLHLKSMNLFKSIGDFCGKFIDIDWSSWCSSVIRIRTQILGPIPSEVPVCYEDKVYPVRIEVPPASIPAVKSSGDLRLKWWKGKSRPFVASAAGNNPEGPDCSRDSLGTAGYSHAVVPSSMLGSRASTSKRVISKWVRKEGPLPSVSVGLSACPSFSRSITHPKPSRLLDLGALLNPLFSVWPAYSAFSMLVSLDISRTHRSADALVINCHFLPSCNPLLSLKPSNRVYSPIPIHETPANPIPTFVHSLNLAPTSCDRSILFALETTSAPSSLPPVSPCTTSPEFVPDSPSLSPTRCSIADVAIPSPSNLESCPDSDTLDSDLPSPSCVPASLDRVWDLSAFPFDLATLEDRSLELSRLFRLEQNSDGRQFELLIKETAKSTHERKIRVHRTKQEMEAHRLGPSPVVLEGPRRSKLRGNGCGGTGSGSNGY